MIAARTVFSDRLPGADSYLGWNEKWNEWHAKGANDVQPLGTHTGGGQVTTKRKASAGMLFKVLKRADVREVRVVAAP